MTLKLAFEPELEEKFRELAMKRYGYGKGAITKAGREAVKKWVDDDFFVGIPRVKTPIKKIRGILSHLKGKYTSVELQHEAMELWGD